MDQLGNKKSHEITMGPANKMLDELLLLDIEYGGDTTATDDKSASTLQTNIFLHLDCLKGNKLFGVQTHLSAISIVRYSPLPLSRFTLFLCGKTLNFGFLKLFLPSRFNPLFLNFIWRVGSADCDIDELDWKLDPCEFRSHFNLNLFIDLFNC